MFCIMKSSGISYRLAKEFFTLLGTPIFRDQNGSFVQVLEFLNPAFSSDQNEFSHIILRTIDQLAHLSILLHWCLRHFDDMLDDGDA